MPAHLGEWALENLIECFRHVIPLLKDDSLQDSISLNNFELLSRPSVQDHFKLGINLEYSKWFKQKFLVMEAEKYYYINNNLTVQCDLLVKSEEIHDAPLHFISAKSKFLQKLFFGKTALEKLNVERLRLFNPKSDRLNVEFPHPICLAFFSSDF